MSNPQNLGESEDTTNKLNKEQVCSCGKNMTIQTDYSYSDGVPWMCPSSCYRKYKSAKNGSIFEKYKYNLRTCFGTYCTLVANWPEIALKRECSWVAGAIDDETNRVTVLHVSKRTQKTSSTFICNP